MLARKIYKKYLLKKGDLSKIGAHFLSAGSFPEVTGRPFLPLRVADVASAGYFLEPQWTFLKLRRTFLEPRWTILELQGSILGMFWMFSDIFLNRFVNFVLFLYFWYFEPMKPMSPLPRGRANLRVADRIFFLHRICLADRSNHSKLRHLIC